MINWLQKQGGYTANGIKNFIFIFFYFFISKNKRHHISSFVNFLIK